ncbi:MAG: Flp pilus assembly complex ATPase component TadA [Candidatus Omnitrophica bacterium]|nr:Flp pilus assembly complex ATPase component TadA [Candidatus Omnitrophota bacterium]
MPPLGELLVSKKIITHKQLELALQRQKETGELLGMVLFGMGLIDEEQVILPILSEQLGIDFVPLRNLDIPKSVINMIPAKFATFYQIIPIEFKNNLLTIATAHPLNLDVIDGAGVIVTSKIKTVLASQKEILEAIRQYYGVGAETIDQMLGAVNIDLKNEKIVDNIEKIDSEASIAKFINQILFAAYKDRATDIHIESFEHELKVRYRVDGVLYDTKLPANIWHFKDSINSRIKIMSNLNIAEKRLPQDGRFKVKVGDVHLDLRVSFVPTQYGENVVIRLLSTAKLYDMKELGLSNTELKILTDLISKPHGIIFVTGPTGSGKTTTLYSCLAQVNQADQKIITIEDPIEYQLRGVTQIQVNPAIGLTFANGLRSMLRQDPDIMMVGEVRDFETAEIAIQIALTGHLVFSTLHTNDAASGVTRLINMGVEPYLVASAVECFIAQRLIRLICPKCKTTGKLTAEQVRDLGLKEEYVNFVVHEGKGCEHCNFTGFYGRAAIYEFLLINDSIRELILSQASPNQIKNKAVQTGMRTLLQHGWEKIKAGETSPIEIIRVTKEENL